MFKGRIYVYRSVNGKKEELSREFDDEKEFDKFIKDNPSLIGKDTKGSSSLSDIRRFLDEAEKMGQKDWVREIEDELKRVFEKSKKLLR